MILMDELFQLMKEKNASDLHLTVGVPPVLRIDGKLFATPFEVLTPEKTQSLIYSIMTDEQKQRFETTNELDFAFSIKNLGRMRVNVYRQRGAYRRFKDFLERRGRIQAWYDYESAATEARLRAWCAEHGIELV